MKPTERRRTGGHVRPAEWHGLQSFGRQTSLPGNQLGDSQLGDTTLSFGYLGDSVGSVIYIGLQC